MDEVVIQPGTNTYKSDAASQLLTERVRTYALETLGFDLVGFAEAEPLDISSARYADWLAKGRHGSMAWMERNLDKRADVRNILSSARSVIVVARNYYTPPSHAESPDIARISRYAWGRDYHKILPKLLKRLLEFISEIEPGAESRYYVDTGPVLEKEWAVRAGIGWMGKHTNVISREFGSWVFLGVLITSAEFVPYAPVSDLCGTCTACLDACPTDAFTAPYQLDATRCISYITIEEQPKNEIIGDLAEKLDNWVFGCDICQDVCPWNRFQRPTTEQSFSPRQGTLDLTLDEIIEMSDDEFTSRFAGTPVMRTKAAGLRRNARGAKSGKGR